MTILVSASACVPIAPPMGLGPISVKRDGESLLVAVCNDISLAGISAQSRGTDSSAKWEPFWTATGHLNMIRGDVIDSATVTEELRPTIVRTPTLSGPIDLEVLLIGMNDEDNLLGSFRLSAEGLSDSAWLHADGSVTNERCPGLEDAPE